jgi:hypothetical protein
VVVVAQHPLQTTRRPRPSRARVAHILRIVCASKRAWDGRRAAARARSRAASPGTATPAKAGGLPPARLAAGVVGARPDGLAPDAGRAAASFRTYLPPPGCNRSPAPSAGLIVFRFATDRVPGWWETGCETRRSSSGLLCFESGTLAWLSQDTTRSRTTAAVLGDPDRSSPAAFASCPDGGR